jgi:hypothetical protein
MKTIASELEGKGEGEEQMASSARARGDFRESTLLSTASHEPLLPRNHDARPI